MKISEFISATKFSIMRIIDMERMVVEHKIQAKKGMDIDVLDEDAYNDLIKMLRTRLKLVKRFTKKSEHIAEEESHVYIASGKEIGEMLDTFTNTLTDDQRQKAIKFFKK